jgi:hypothetical protein
MKDMIVLMIYTEGLGWITFQAGFDTSEDRAKMTAREIALNEVGVKTRLFIRKGEDLTVKKLNKMYGEMIKVRTKLSKIA